MTRLCPVCRQALPVSSDRPLAPHQKRIVALIRAGGGAPVSQDALVAALYGAVTTEKELIAARRSVRVNIYMIRNRRGAGVIETVKGGYRLKQERNER